MLFSKLKHWLRQAAGRSVEAICSTLAETLSAVTATECRNYFVCTAPGSLDNRVFYAARLKVSSCQAARMSAGLR
jgi:uncharacterized membrane protein AbrB (regulator of aidB expression)